MSKTLAALDWATGPIPSALAIAIAVLIGGWWKGLEGGLIALLAFVFVPFAPFMSWVFRQEAPRDSRAVRRSLISLVICAIAGTVLYVSIQLFWPDGSLVVFMLCVAMIFVVGYGELVGEIVRMGRRFERRAD